MPNPTTKQQLVATNAIQYYGTGIKGAQKALSTRYLETIITISIHSTLPENLQTAGSKYDYKSGLEINLKAKAAKSLYKVIKRAAAFISEGTDFEPIAVSSATNLIEVSNGEKFGLKPALTLAIYSDISSEKTTETYDVFQFMHEKLITNYDRNNGTYGETYIDTDIELFRDQLDEFVRGSTNAAAHFTKKEIDKYRLATIRSSQIKIMDKLGIQSDFRYGQSYVQNKPTPSPANTRDGGGAQYSDMSSEDLLNELDNI